MHGKTVQSVWTSLVNVERNPNAITLGELQRMTHYLLKFHSLYTYHLKTIEFFLKVFTEFLEFSDKIYVITVKGLEPATQPRLVLKTRMLPQYQQDTCETQDL